MFITRTFMKRIAQLTLLLGFSAALQAQAPAGPGPGGPSGGPPGAMGGPPPAAPIEKSYPNGITGLMDMTYRTLPGFRPLKLDLFYAATDQRPKPAVVYIHGGAWGGGQPRAAIMPSWGTTDNVLARLAARGYVTVGVTYRLSGEAKFPAQIHDIKAAVRWLRANAAKYNIDPARIAVWGESAGGQLADLMGTTCGVKELEGTVGNLDQSSCVQAVVSWYALTDFNTLEAQSGPEHVPAHGVPGGPLSTYLGCVLAQCDPAFVKLASPIYSISADDPPFLVMAGDADKMVPPDQSRTFDAALRAKGVSSQLVIVPGVNHIWRGATDAQGAEIIKTTNEFLDAKLGVKAAAK